MISRRSLRTVLPSAVLAAALTACSTGPSDGGATSGGSADASSSTASAGTFPATVEHAYGSTTVTAAPKRIATVGWNDQDIVASLGSMPVAATKITWGGNAAGSTDWFDAKARELGSDPSSITRYDDTAGAPIDEIAKATPDLILAVNSGITKDEYTKLSKIAPTVAFPKTAWATTWQQSVTSISQAMGKPEEGKQLLTQTEKVVEDGAAKHPALKGKSAAWVWFTPTDLSTVGIYTSSDARPSMLRAFGMTDPGVVKTLSKGTSQFSANLSAEKAKTLDADVLVFYQEKPGQADALKKNPLLGQIPALKSGHYIASADNQIALSMSLPSPLSLPVAVEKFLPKLESAVQGTPAS